MLERAAYISDQRLYRCGGRWFTTASFPLAHICRKLHLREWVFWGRRYEISEPGNLLHLEPPQGVDLRIEGPWEQERGAGGYLRAAVWHSAALRRVVRSSNLVWLRLPFVFPLLASRHCRGHQVVATHMVGDPAASMAAMSPLLGVAGRALSWACRHLIRRADLAAFVSRDLARRYGGGRSDLLVGNETQISAEMLSRSPPPRNTGRLRLLFIGRLSPEKRVEDLLQALSARGECDLTVAGEGLQAENLRQLAGRLGVTDRLTWAGYVPWGPALFALIRRHDVLVLPSVTEGLGLVIIEAMSQGIPAIGTRVGGIPELIEHGRNGLLVPCCAPVQLAEAIGRLADNRELLARLAEGALATSQNHTVERQLGPLLERMNRLAEEKAVYNR